MAVETCPTADGDWVWCWQGRIVCKIRVHLCSSVVSILLLPLERISLRDCQIRGVLYKESRCGFGRSKNRNEIEYEKSSPPHRSLCYRSHCRQCRCWPGPAVSPGCRQSVRRRQRLQFRPRPHYRPILADPASPGCPSQNRFRQKHASHALAHLRPPHVRIAKNDRQLRDAID